MDIVSLAREVRAQDYERFICCLCSPHAQQMPLLTALAFSAELAKITSMAHDPAPAYIRLKWWQEQLAAIQSGAPVVPHPLVGALSAIHRDYSVLAPHLLQMIDGRAMEMETRKGFTDHAAFNDYLDATAGALHLALALIASGEELDEVSQNLVRRSARLYATMGLIRSIPAHAQQGVVRWPHDRLRQFGLSPAAVEQGVEQEALRHFLMFWCEQIIRESETLTENPQWKAPALRIIRRLHHIASRYVRRLAKSEGDITAVISRLPNLPVSLWLVR